MARISMLKIHSFEGAHTELYVDGSTEIANTLLRLAEKINEVIEAVNLIKDQAEYRNKIGRGG